MEPSSYTFFSMRIWKKWSGTQEKRIPIWLGFFGLIWVFFGICRKKISRWILGLPSYTKFLRLHCLCLWSPSSWCVWCVPTELWQTTSESQNLVYSGSQFSLLFYLLQTIHCSNQLQWCLSNKSSLSTTESTMIVAFFSYDCNIVFCIRPVLHPLKIVS